MNSKTDEATHEIHFYGEPRRWAVRHFKVRSGDSPLRHFFIVYDGAKMYEHSGIRAFQGNNTRSPLSEVVRSQYTQKEFGNTVLVKLNELMETNANE